MENLSKHLEILFYIVAFFSGISCLTMVVFFSTREKRAVFLKTVCFLAVTFAYLTVNFLQFYKEFFFMSPKMSILLMLMLDVSMCALVCSWILFARRIAYPADTFRKPGIVVSLCAVYVLGWLLVYLFFTDPDYYISESFGKNLSALLDCLFYCCILIYILCNLVGQIKSGIPFTDKVFLTVINGMVLAYLGWFYINDITLIYIAYGAELWEVYPYDPVTLFYILINITTMVYYYKRNEAFSADKKSDSEIQLDEAAGKYDLTKREAEITYLVYLGLSNPEISERLYISPFTVKRHMQNIFKKMNIKHRTELIHLIKSQ